jgi:hypothetical protein
MDSLSGAVKRPSLARASRRRVNESFHERFEVEATRAGIAALRSAMSGEAGDVWLHQVFFDLLEHKSELLFAAGRRDRRAGLRSVGAPLCPT